MGNAKTIVGGWGWVSAHKDGKPQPTFFDSAEAALQGMRERLDDPELDLKALDSLGLRLAMLTITIEADMVMLPLPDRDRHG